MSIKRFARWQLVMASLLASPFLLVGVILLEAAIFRTRYISDTAELLGLTYFLMTVFNFLGLNG